MVNFGALAAELFVSLGHPSQFQRVSRLGSVTTATSLNGSQPNFARCLAVSWVFTLYIHFRGLLLRNGILPSAKFTFRLSLALSYIGSVTTRHSSSGCQPNFAALSRRRHLYSAGWPSRLALAHILVLFLLLLVFNVCFSCKDIARQRVRRCPEGEVLAIFWVLHFQRAACSRFQACVLNLH